MDPAKQARLEEAIRRELNCHSAENDSDTPDWILADYLIRCLRAFNHGVQQRERWYGREKQILPCGHPDAPTPAPEKP